MDEVSIQQIVNLDIIQAKDSRFVVVELKSHAISSCCYWL